MKDKRQAILEATRILLAQYGFHGFSMKQLAQQAGVAAGTVYLYFKDKEDLIRQLHEQILADVAECVFANHDTSRPLFEQYRQLWRSFWAFCIDHPDVVLSKDQFDHLPPDIQQAQQANAERLFAPMLVMFDRGRHEKALKPLPDEVLSSLSIETCSVLARKQLLGQITLDDAAQEAAITASWDAIALASSGPTQEK